MSFDNQSDRDILIETATNVRALRERMDKESERREKTEDDIENRVRSLERLRYMIWGAVLVATGSATELVRHLLGGGK